MTEHSRYTEMVRQVVRLQEQVAALTAERDAARRALAEIALSDGNGWIYSGTLSDATKQALASAQSAALQAAGKEQQP